jgi:hypothetical protein
VRRRQHGGRLGSTQLRDAREVALGAPIDLVKGADQASATGTAQKYSPN